MLEVIETGIGRSAVRKNSGATDVGQRRRLNLIEGTNVTLTVVDDPTDDEIDVTITAAGGGHTFAAPAIVLGAAAVEGNAETIIRSNATIVAFDATAPSTQAFGDAAVVGTAAYAPHRDHKHAMMASPLTAKAITVAMLADGTDGNLITWGADGVATVVATGNAGQILTSAGAGAPPTFAAAPAAGDITTDGAWTAAGDLIVGTGADTAAIVSIGAEEVVARIGAANIDGIAMAVQTVLARLTGASIDDVAIGIANDNIVQIDQADVADNDFAKFTANGLEGRSYSEVLSDIGAAPSSGIALSALANQAAQTIDMNATDGAASPTAIAIAASQIVARLAAGNLKGCSVAEIKTLLAYLGSTADVALADHTWDGRVISATAGEAFAINEVGYFKAADSKFWKATGNAVATADGLLAMATAAINAEAVGVFLIDGIIRNDDGFGGAMTVNAPYYLSAATGGAITATSPAATGNQSRRLGVAYAARILKFSPSPDIFQVA